MHEDTPDLEDITIDRYVLDPTDDIVEALVDHWSWIFEQDMSIIMMSRMGDVFLEDDNGIVYWLNTGTSEIDRIASSQDEFQKLLETECFDDWFLSELIDACHDAGLVPTIGEVLSYKILPVFEGGSYDIENMQVMSAVQHLTFTGDTLLAVFEAEQEDDSSGGNADGAPDA